MKNITIRSMYKMFYPLALSMICTSLLGLIDSYMLISFNEYSVSAVNISNQLTQVFMPIIFAVCSTISIFCVQFYESKKYDKINKYFNVSIVVSLFFGFIQFIIGHFFSGEIASYFFEENSVVFNMAVEYMRIASFIGVLIAIEQCINFQLRIIKKTKVIFWFAIFKALCNILLNYVLIYGNFGFQSLGVEGAAIATIISFSLSNILLVIFCGFQKFGFLNLKKFDLSIKGFEFVKLLKVMWPLILVEFLFGYSRVIQTKIFAMTGIEYFNLMQYANIFSFIFNTFVITTASVCAIVIGSTLVYKDLEYTNLVLKNVKKFMWYNSLIVFLANIIIVPILMYFLLSDLQQFKLIYLILISNALYMSIRVFNSSFLGILKSGGQTKITIFIDGGISFIVAIPVLYVSFLLFEQNLIIMKYFLIIENIVRLFICLYFLNLNKWQNKL